MAIDITVHYSDPASDPMYKQPFTIQPGETNTSSTSLTLVGQGTMNYGRHIMEDLLHIMENFCSDKEPAVATRGQLWYDINKDTLQVAEEIITAVPTDPNDREYDEQGNPIPVRKPIWRTVGGVHVSTTPPVDKHILWFDISDPAAKEWQLKIFNSGLDRWVSVAEEYVRQSGDYMTGDLEFTVTEKGITANVAGVTNRITPNSSVGPAMLGGKNAAVVINKTNGSEFVVGAGATLTEGVSAGQRYFTVSIGSTGSGEVGVHNSNLNLHNNRLLQVSPALNRTDGPNYGQVMDADNHALDLIADLSGRLNNQSDDLDNKVSKTGDVMSGPLNIGNTLTVGLSATFLNGISVTTGSALFAGNTTVGGTLGVSGSTTLNALTVGSTAQFNNVLSVSGAATFTSSATIRGEATMDNTVTMKGTLNVTGAATFQTTPSASIPVNQITNAKHLTTKEYVDGKIAGQAQPPQPRTISVGSTTLANIATTYSNITAFPVGTMVHYNYTYSYSWGYGNGTSTETRRQSMTALRTESGWVNVVAVGAMNTTGHNGIV